MCSRTGSQLGARGYHVLPEPQRVELTGTDVEFDANWQVTTEGSLTVDDDLVEVLRECLDERHCLTVGTRDCGSRGPAIVLVLEPRRTVVEEATDRDTLGLAAQSYELQATGDLVRVSAPERAGLFYGIVTLVQLIRSDQGRLWLPEGVITDWPDVGRRHLFWDNSEHLDRLETLKAAVRKAAMYKVNGVVLKLDSHFVYESAPALADPNALMPAELQELTDYAQRYHVQLIPYIDAPGHLAWLLKHPEYRNLREFADCNYELCTTDPGSYRLLEGLFDDLLSSNQGVEHFVLSTDEPYYIGLGRSRARAAELGSVGKLEAEFVRRAAGYLRDRGRTVQIWGEYPIEREDIPSLPPYLINGVANGPKYDPVYARNGIRQFLYVSTQAELQNFPDYYPADPADLINPVGSNCSVAKLHEELSFHPARRQDNVVGVFVAAWADAGLHPETFWLGFVCGAAWAWHPGCPEPGDAVERFGRLFYGDGVRDTAAVYELMSVQAQFFESSWDRCDSTARTPIFGGPYEIYDSPRPAKDQSVPLPDLPDRTLSRGSRWRRTNLR
ncbi:glycoside hydrolase family 20 zincin-like fold domain-containing protein [Actinopolymorpha pittospori]|uniref:beta-N-acetylhexosaminidase n=1 Tax=Actinopolymorpha pittospori TaxID=648752 RepID=A0A927MZ02_9ACTN|nr:glycoside hydrolase family 20 zincin-like fold domain-containing protein [Actinopolymorpha pittospori]MBE1609159.1 hypothetical protein [Actinopolymorpha pittospori]